MALACSALLAAVRPTWRTVLLDMAAPDATSPPPGLQSWSGVRRVVLSWDLLGVGAADPWDASPSTAHSIGTSPDFSSAVLHPELPTALSRVVQLLRPAPAVAASTGQRSRPSHPPLQLTCLLPETRLSALGAVLALCGQPDDSSGGDSGDSGGSADSGNRAKASRMLATQRVSAEMLQPLLAEAGLPGAAQMGMHVHVHVQMAGGQPRITPGRPFDRLEVWGAQQLDDCSCAELLTACSTTWTVLDEQLGMRPAPQLGGYSRLTHLRLTGAPSLSPAGITLHGHALHSGGSLPASPPPAYLPACPAPPCLAVPGSSPAVSAAEESRRFSAFLAAQLPLLPRLEHLQLGRPCTSAWISADPFQIELGEVELPGL